MVIKHIKKLFLGKNNYIENQEFNSLKSSVRNSFEFLKDDMKKQRLWINHLYALNNKLNQTHDELKSHHKNHDIVHSRDVDNLNKWVSHLKDSQKKHDNDIQKLESSIKNAFGTYNRYMMDMYKMIHSLKSEVNIISKKHEEHERNFETKFEELHTNPLTNTNLIESSNNVRLNDPMRNQNIALAETTSNSTQKDETSDLTNSIKKIAENLTRSEKLLILQLMDTDQKLSYKDLGVLTNSSTSTIKNHICNIKNKGFPIKEYKDENNAKRYYVEDHLKNILLSEQF